MSELSERLRARALEALVLIANEDVQRQYQAQVPHVDVAAEIFNQWEESFLPEHEEFRHAFTDVEWEALERFNDVLVQVSAQTPPDLAPLDEFIRTEAWQRLSTAAGTALEQVKR